MSVPDTRSGRGSVTTRSKPRSRSCRLPSRSAWRLVVRRATDGIGHRWQIRSYASTLETVRRHPRKLGSAVDACVVQQFVWFRPADEVVAAAFRDFPQASSPDVDDCDSGTWIAAPVRDGDSDSSTVRGPESVERAVPCCCQLTRIPCPDCLHGGSFRTDDEQVARTSPGGTPCLRDHDEQGRLITKFCQANRLVLLVAPDHEDQQGRTGYGRDG